MYAPFAPTVTLSANTTVPAGLVTVRVTMYPLEAPVSTPEMTPFGVPT